MQGKKNYSEKLFNSFQLSERVPKENFYRRLKEKLDLKFMYARTAHLYGDTGNPSTDPVVFFKLMLVGYLENISSDRKLIEHCSMRMDILFFLGYDIDEELPWHSTVSRTRQLYDEKLFEELFSKIFSLCVESGMVSGHTQAIDSAYIKANASMESIEMKQTPSESVNEFLKKGNEENFTPQRKAKENKASEEQKTISSTEKELKQLQTRNEYFKENKIEHHGNKAEKTFQSFSNQTHYSPTDPDARISTKPGKPRQLNYLCSMAVDTAAGVISHIQADYADRKDSRYTMDITAKTKAELKQNKITLNNLLADTGYSSGLNYHELEKQNITAYIPTSGVYKHDREGFTYNKEDDSFTCRNNKKLPHKKTYTNTAGQLMKSYRSSRKDCRDCPFRKTCLGKKAQEKKLELSYYQEEYERAWQRQQTKHFKHMVRLRHGTIEPVFGNLINYYGLRKINTKGIRCAHKCMLMSAIAFNLKKLMKFLSRKRNSNLQAVQRELCALYKTVFCDFICSLLPYPNFATPNVT
jgi:transposase